MAEMRDLAADGQPPSAEQIARVMARYATEPARPRAVNPGPDGEGSGREVA